MRLGRALKTPVFRVMSIMLLIPLFLVFSAHLIVCQSLSETLMWAWDTAGIFMFEVVVIYIFCVLIYGLTTKLWLCATFVTAPYLSITIISYYKLVINGTPLLISDFCMVGQFGEIVGFALPQVTVSPYTLFGVLVPIALIIILAFVDKKVNDPRYVLTMVPISSLLVALFLFSPIFTSWAVMLDDEDKFQEQRCAEYGPAMGMYCTYAQGRRDGRIYTKDAVERVKEQVDSVLPTEAAEKTPSVIMLLSESFFDVAKLENLAYRPDPIPNFHRLKKTYQSGDFISSAYCGGTGYVEMEVLTGICSNLLREGDTLTYLTQKDVYKRIPAISDVFKDYGYKTVYLHAYNNELYNREHIYTQLGFDEVMFDEDFEEFEKRGGYISDETLADKIISVHEESGKERLFLYAVSMENHQPYTADKYPETLINVESDRLTEDELAVLEAYITGVYDADKALGRLIRYFSKQEEPVMLVFFGDHMPNLMVSEDESIFTKLGYIGSTDTTGWDHNELKKMLSTDYLIWTNYEDTDFVNSTQSSNFLGNEVLSRLSLDKTKYYRWLSDRVAPHMLMHRSRLFVDEAGKASAFAGEEHADIIEDYAVAVYDIIYGDNKIFNISR